MADRLVLELSDLGIDAIAIHGDLRQETRERNLGRFRDNQVDVLVATEVAARGLDIDGMTHVINFDCPDDEKMYLHRVGRTARAGEQGVAVTLATHAEVDRLNVIRKALDLREHTFEEVFSTSGELTERFGLPETTPWDQFARGGGTETSRRAKRARGSDTSEQGPPKRDRKPAKRSRRAAGGDREPARAGRRPVKSQRTSDETERASAESGGPEESKRDGTEIVRTRTRSRVTPESEGATADDASEPSRPDGARSADRSRSRSATSDSAGKRSSSRSSSGSRSGSRSRSTSGSKASARDGSRRTPRRDDDSSRGERSERPEPLTNARGDGQPRLSRPLKVEHIP
jgi:superfamily II DNA/RNA helicase